VTVIKESQMTPRKPNGQGTTRQFQFLVENSAFILIHSDTQCFLQNTHFSDKNVIIVYAELVSAVTRITHWCSFSVCSE